MAFVPYETSTFLLGDSFLLDLAGLFVQQCLEKMEYWHILVFYMLSMTMLGLVLEMLPASKFSKVAGIESKSIAGYLMRLLGGVSLLYLRPK